MPETREIPEVPGNPEFPWVKDLNPAHRQEYEQARAENIEEMIPHLLTKFELYFPALVEGDPEMVAAFVKRWAVGLRNTYEEGIQEGQDVASRKFRAERDEHHLREVMRLGGWG